MDYSGYWQSDNENRSFKSNKTALFTFLSIILAAISGLAEPVALFSTLSCVFLIAAVSSVQRKSTAKTLLIVFTSLIPSVFLTVAGGFWLGFFTKENLILGIVKVTSVLSPFILAAPILICLHFKKDSETTVKATIISTAIFAGARDLASIFAQYRMIDKKAILLYIEDAKETIISQSELLKLTAAQAKEYASFIMRLTVSLYPGVCVLIATVQVFVVIALLKKILKDKFKSGDNSGWKITLAFPSAIINAVCIAVFTIGLLSSSVTPLTAVAGNFVLIFATSSIMIGLGGIIYSFKKSKGLFGKLLNALPFILFFISPVSALIYVSFIGSYYVIVAKIESTFIRKKSDE